MSQNRTMADWVAVEWTEHQQRAWLMSKQGDVLDTLVRSSAHEVGDARQNEVLSNETKDGITSKVIPFIDHWLMQDSSIDVLYCGEGAQGIPSMSVPCQPLDAACLVAQEAQDPRLRLFALGEVSQTKPLDVLQEQVIQIAGYLAQFPKFDGVLCLTGQHTKWVRVSAQEIVSFESYLTGQMLALLSHQAELKACNWPQAHNDIFTSSVEDILSKPEKLAARLYDVQAHAAQSAGLKAGLYERLAGLLIGAEIASARPYWLGQDVVLLGGHELETPYLRALSQQGAMVRCAELTDTVLLGLAAVRKTQIEKET